MTLNDPFDAEYLRNGMRYRQFQVQRNTNRDLHTPYSTLSFRLTLSDLGWLSKTCNDTKRRAVSLWQLSLLINMAYRRKFNFSTEVSHDTQQCHWTLVSFSLSITPCSMICLFVLADTISAVIIWLAFNGQNIVIKNLLQWDSLSTQQHARNKLYRYWVVEHALSKIVFVNAHHRCRWRRGIRTHSPPTFPLPDNFPPYYIL